MMNFRLGAAVVLAAGAACGFHAHAQVNEDAAAVLNSAADAIGKIHAVSYKSRLYGVGALKDLLDGDGEVKQVRVAGQSGRFAPAWMKGSVKEIGRGKTPFTVSVWNTPEGPIVEWIDDPSNTHFRRPTTDRTEAQRLISMGTTIAMSEFAETAPFSKQLKAQKVELKPRETIRGVECDVVFASWENDLRSETWWIGVGDHLPRKVELAHGRNDLAKGTEIWDLQLLPNLQEADLALKTPAGYKEDFQSAKQAPPPVVKQPNQPQNLPPAPAPIVGIPPGNSAPEFDLRSGDGSSVKLSTLQGQVVVLTFGGSRFPKTDAVNAVVNDVLAANKDGVKAYTLACREESDQVALDHAKKTGISFPVLLGADAVRQDYRVSGFPFTYVLTADGRVSKAFQGVVHKEQLEHAVAAALRGEVAIPPPVVITAPSPSGKQPVPAPNLGSTPK